MFSYFSAEERVAAKHPLRSIKAYTDSAGKQLRPLLDGITVRLVARRFRRSAC
jgi:hypothetical protein